MKPTYNNQAKPSIKKPVYINVQPIGGKVGNTEEPSISIRKPKLESFYSVEPEGNFMLDFRNITNQEM